MYDIIIYVYTFTERVSTVSQAPMDDLRIAAIRIYLMIHDQLSDIISKQQVFSILLDTELIVNKVCTRQPTNVTHNTYTVNVSKLKCFKNVYCDDMGSWHCNGAYKSWIEVRRFHWFCYITWQI